MRRISAETRDKLFMHERPRKIKKKETNQVVKIIKIIKIIGYTCVIDTVLSKRWNKKNCADYRAPFQGTGCGAHSPQEVT